MTAVELYRLSTLENEEGRKAKLLLRQSDWFTRMLEFDPRSGEAMTQSLTSFLRKVASDSRSGERWKVHDRLARLTDHCRQALERVIRGLNESPRREHAEMPIRNVRELDAACFRKLNNRPGRTIREKLASRPYLQAVRRFQSIDLPENQLVKAFAQRVVELLRERALCLGSWLHEMPDDLIDVLERWLHSEEGRSISRWENPPPNNTLLSHRDYRKIYDSWCWMQSLDAKITDDFRCLEERQACIEFWQYIAELRFHKDILLDEVPVSFIYDDFVLRSRLGGGILAHDRKGCHKLTEAAYSLNPSPKNRKEDPPLPIVEQPACVDFIEKSLAFTTGGKCEVLSAPLAWQLWETKEGRDVISLFNAQSVYEGGGVTTIRASDFFTSPDAIREHAHQAALSIATDLRRVFHSDSLIWLVPDIVDDFQLTPLRQGINTVFVDATPVPRSVAAVVQKVDVKRIERDGFAVAVIDRMGDDVFVTKLVARFDARLKAVLPNETHGYAWERQPAVRVNPKKMKEGQVDFGELVKLVGPIVYTIYVKSPPVLGGFLLRDREKCVPDIPLWYDQLPELSTKIPINGVYDYFYFVEKVRVSPQRGVARPITIKQEFTLPPGQQEYEFPLYMGSGHNASRFVASLRSSCFPLKTAVRCSLKMTYTYGESQPYSLTFKPLNGALKPMTVAWEPKRTSGVDFSFLPVPDFPVKYRWDALATDGILSQLADRFEEIHGYISGARNSEFVLEKRRELDDKIANMEGRQRSLSREKSDVLNEIDDLEGSWLLGRIKFCAQDKNNTPFCRVICEESGKDVFCHSSKWADDISAESLVRDESVWVWCQPDSRHSGQFFGAWMSRSPDRPKRLDKMIADKRNYIIRLEGKASSIDERIGLARVQRESISDEDIRPLVKKALWDAVKLCRVPISIIWDNGRSCRDEAAPEWFRNRMETALRSFDADFCNKYIPAEFKTKLATMLYPLHKDIPSFLIEADKRDIAERGIDASSVRHVGYALGDSSLDWQGQLLEWMLEQAEEGRFLILRAFSISLWRSENLVFKLHARGCRVLCSTLKKSLKSIIARIESSASSMSEKRGVDDRMRKELASARYNFEVMLALVRLRRGADSEVAHMFAPESRNSTALLELVDSFAKILATHQLTLFSRISLNIDKPKTLGATPDLLYALRLLLSGDDGASAISINEVGDDEVGNEEISGLMARKISDLGNVLGLQYQCDQNDIHELHQDVWGCQYWTKDSRERPWEQAFVCVHPKYGCCETHGGICEYWNKMGGWASPLGLPISDEKDFYENNQVRGRISHFEHGDVIWLNEENRIDVRMKAR